ncbi:hypothetical protein V6N13_145382 [Hibiscus sabdariffa]
MPLRKKSRGGAVIQDSQGTLIGYSMFHLGSNEANIGELEKLADVIGRVDSHEAFKLFSTGYLENLTKIPKDTVNALNPGTVNSRESNFRRFTVNTIVLPTS